MERHIAIVDNDGIHLYSVDGENITFIDTYSKEMVSLYAQAEHEFNSVTDEDFKKYAIMLFDEG